MIIDIRKLKQKIWIINDSQSFPMTSFWQFQIFRSHLLLEGDWLRFPEPGASGLVHCGATFLQHTAATGAKIQSGTHQLLVRRAVLGGIFQAIATHRFFDNTLPS